MYEVEIKTEVSQEELARLISECRARGFLDEGVVPQCDYYVKAVESAHGDPKAFDIERYRVEGDTFLFTKKDWDTTGPTPIRREEERAATRAELEATVAKYPKALKIPKNRHRLAAAFEGVAITLSFDSVKFDHSPNVRHFMEPEILVSDKALVPETKKLLRRFAADLLGVKVEELVEAPGMFAMAFKKL